MAAAEEEKEEKADNDDDSGNPRIVSTFNAFHHKIIFTELYRFHFHAIFSDINFT
jgi:hypothetical protein